MQLTMNDDGSITIEWDENNPEEAHLNEFSEEDFLQAIEAWVDIQMELTPEWDDELA